jgi:two-component system NarL family response regulator
MDIFLVDDHTLFREGLASILEQEAGFRVIGQAGSVGEAIQMAPPLRPDLILMDYSLPDGNGPDATRQILAAMPNALIVFLTMHENEESLFSAIQSGAKGFLLKNMPVNKLVAAIHGLEEGVPAVAPAAMKTLIDHARGPDGAGSSRLSQGQRDDELSTELTFREIEVIQELAQNASNREIAHRLVITENTVKSHVHSILEKLSCKNRRQVITYARRHGLLDEKN